MSSNPTSPFFRDQRPNPALVLLAVVVVIAVIAYAVGAWWPV
jgi:hypothetical protein